jgi:transketolase
MDLMIALYFRVMKVRPQEPQWSERDRFILSKGHSSVGQYTVMALRGYLPVEELKTFDKGRSRLQGHLAGAFWRSMDMTITRSFPHWKRPRILEIRISQP